MTITIAMIIAPKGYQDTEFNIPYKYFLDNKATVDVYSTRIGVATGSIGGMFDVKHNISELNVKDYDAIVFIGGPGTRIVRSDDNSTRIALDAHKLGKVVGAICWSPTILAMAGILKGKNATVWKGMDEEFGMLTSEYLESSGARYDNQEVIVDGNIITSNGPGAAQKYAQKVWDALQKRNVGKKR